MPRLLWTPEALQDLARLHAFLAVRNKEAARRAIRRIRQGVRVLSRYPETGRQVEEMPSEFRQRIIPFGNSGYLVLYRYDGDVAAILAVRHGREAGY